MTNKPKIKIIDDNQLRQNIEKKTHLLSQVELARWALIVAKRTLPYLENEFKNELNIENGFKINELWQHGNATVYQVRQAGFKVHEVARKCKSETARAAARSIGQAIGVGHMREHVMITSDYAIKAINLAFNNDINQVIEEREWQLQAIKVMINKN